MQSILSPDTQLGASLGGIKPCISPLADEAERLDPGEAIYVRAHDRRCSTLGVWLSLNDVRWVQ